MKLKLKDIGPNPFRDLQGNPLIEAKIQELMASIKLTGYWQNVVVCKRQGKWVLAYGHHRWEAARRCGITEADFIVMDLDDAKLIQVLDNENRETYASSPASLIESVRAVVSALAEGSIPAFEIDPKTSEDRRRYAPSYVPYNACSGENMDATKAYTASSIAHFLGRTMAKGEGDRPAKAIVAALDFLCLKELGKINNSVLIKDNRPISATKLAEITTAVKQRYVAEVVRRDKTQAELNKLRETQVELQRKQKEQEKEAEEAHKALLKKEADARRAENDRKAVELAVKRKEADERAKEKEALNKLRMTELDAKIAQKKEWEKQQRVQDDYAPIRRDVESLMGKLEMMVSERNPMREEVKALGKQRKLRPEDRIRLRKAVGAVSDWFGSWVTTQFAAPLTEKQELSEMSKREKGNK